MGPELPYLGAGIVSIVGGAIREKKWPETTVKSLVGTVALVIAASATADTRFAPLVRAVGMLLLLTSIMAAVKAANQAKGGK
jgi:dolichol kinase